MKENKSVCMMPPCTEIGACFGLVVVVLGPNQLRTKTVCCCICAEIIYLSMNKTYLLSSFDRKTRPHFSEAKVKLL
ncbi:hypothetical protein AG1IA_02674 [Rhizoctonia solani AG-1 IA]|uniref:Uncharacterized protein n=1 Tax=Thanatephorus cucumeris (strain AG1-IA) TaxID=983506 RepID=L8X2K2_THACA|nr:hypothetical protein AG1IA_02674 [Rhizoctonia solani AG-1 IA]